jgi:hypothetical protein
VKQQGYEMRNAGIAFSITGLAGSLVGGLWILVYYFSAGAMPFAELGESNLLWGAIVGAISFFIVLVGLVLLAVSKSK